MAIGEPAHMRTMQNDTCMGVESECQGVNSQVPVDRPGTGADIMPYAACHPRQELT